MNTEPVMSHEEALAVLDKVRALLPELGEPRFNDQGYFEGMTTGPAAYHRTAGTRAWSDAGEWCYPHAPCTHCEPRIEPRDLLDVLDQKSKTAPPPH